MRDEEASMISPPRRALFPLFALLLVAAAARADLRGEIEIAIRGGSLDGASVGISVLEAGPGAGRTLVGLRDDEMMIPASNLKLFTTGAALHMLGAEFRFKTRMIRSRARLTIVGDGDPGFGDPDLLALMTAPGEEAVGMGVEQFLDLWVEAVVASGVEHLEEIVVDDSVFDREYVHPTWPRDQLNRRYCAEVSGLAFHLNQIHFYPVPRPGQRPSLTLYEPRTSAIIIDNNATSETGVHGDDTVWIARKLGTNRLTFYGNVKHRYRTPVPATVHAMPSLFGDLFAERLRLRGIRVDRVRLIEPAEVPTFGPTLGPAVYTPITTAIARCNRDSQNLYAESLTKRMGYAATGQPGSWLNGASIVRLVVHERLQDAAISSRLKIADGSGLSRDNAVAPATLTAWLNTFHNDPSLGPLFIESLAVGGESGTLRHRFESADLHGATVHGKSGYINGVSCLSGYVTMPDGRRCCFSIMINDLHVPTSRAKKLQERVVQAIADEMARTAERLGAASE
jgi:D-alanyl-D-alanine carboxypeptidase/D-alanyl-D-alanine-endopeptidase (penicillin-binding protein 4)